MAPIPSSPNDYRDCLFYRLLKDKSTAGDSAVEKFDLLVEHTAPLLDSIISGPFKHFTLHNRDHAKKLLHLCQYVIDESTVHSLSVLNCLVIAYAAYLHDAGMALSSLDDRNKILESQQFQDTLTEWPELSDALRRARMRLQEISSFSEEPHPGQSDIAAFEAERLQLEGDVFQLQEAALVAYLRPRHATEQRYRQLFSFLKKTSTRNDLFEFRGISFEQQLINICVSHNLEAGVLAEVRTGNDERFPRDLLLAGQRLNSQFCAAALRITDALDFDRERTPRVLFESLGISSRSLPGAEISLQEWQRHLAVHSIDIRKDEIVVAAESKHPVVEKAIREYCELIEREIRDTSTVLAHNTAEVSASYKLRLPIIVRPQVTSVGYVYKEMSLGMNQVAIMSLLMGEHLYSRKGVALRELIQNSVDACAAREKLTSGPGYVPEIRMRIHTDGSGYHWIEIQDNGLGMDEHVLSEYFLKLGNSYYRSPEFQRLSHSSGSTSQFVPISRFGIGVASLFMIGDVLEVATKASHSPRGDNLGRLVRIERMGGLAYVAEGLKGEAGTRIRVRLRQEIQRESEKFVKDIGKYLKEVVVRPKVDVAIDLDGDRFTTRHQKWFGLKKGAEKVLAQLEYEIVPILLSEFSSRISGVAYLLVRRADAKLSLFNDSGSRIHLFSKPTNPDLIFDGYVGNRITVNGFKMGLRKQKSFYAQGKKSLPLTFDIEIQSDDSVVFDVARDRLLGDVKPALVNEFRSSIYRALLQTRILDKLGADSRELAEHVLLGRYTNSPTTRGIDESLLTRVQQLVPTDRWLTGMHKRIADELGISPSAASKAIQILLDRDLIKNPTSPSEDGPASKQN